jgi:hypothetical protein
VIDSDKSGFEPPLDEDEQGGVIGLRHIVAIKARKMADQDKTTMQDTLKYILE